ncbi:MAG: hypothetical protein J0J01_04275 [Reyranella sp.]|uniref:hypothetical protein n=1 Tax=Reyranella sp. TaxID=1929291 RepID=UPI001AC7D31C|nr:hypothetical protein [Reyranella sp.]MBN9086105.1 hypothetical protein [Reyranella sp.]
MRLLLASVATLAAVALAVPAFAQEAAPATTPTPMTTAKPKPGTAAYCNTLKSSTSKSSCLKRVHASAKSTKAPATTTHKKAKKLEAPKSTDTSAQLTPPAASPSSAQSPPQTINVPPLPQKTI